MARRRTGQGCTPAGARRIAVRTAGYGGFPGGPVVDGQVVGEGGGPRVEVVDIRSAPGAGPRDGEDDETGRSPR